MILLLQTGILPFPLNGKHATVLIADIVASTEIIRARDPEQADEILVAVVELMREGVQRFRGNTADFRGDGVLALYGAPFAQEDHISARVVRLCGWGERQPAFAGGSLAIRGRDSDTHWYSNR